MEYIKKAAMSSGVAKVAAALGGTALGINLLNGNNPLGGGIGPLGGNNNCYVNVREMALIQEGASKDATIAGLQAEKYTDNVVAATVAPLAQEICDLKVANAVNAARDADFRRYVEREFVHQPKAFMKNCIVTTTPDCCCDDAPSAQ